MSLLARHMNQEHVIAGLAAALRAGALTSDAVALEARKAAEADSSPPQQAASGFVGGDASHAAAVTFSTQRRLANLPSDTRPLPSVAVYDQLLRHHPPGSGSETAS